MNDRHRHHKEPYINSKSGHYASSGSKILKNSAQNFRVVQSETRYQENSLSKGNKFSHNNETIVNNIHKNDHVNYILSKYSKFIWEDVETQNLYQAFKEIEKVFDAMIDRDCRQALNVVSDFNAVRDFLTKAAIRIIQLDLKFAQSKDLDKRIWALIRKQLENLSKAKARSDNVEQETTQLIDINMAFLKTLMEIISKKGDISEFPLSESCIERKVISNILSYFGELSQFKEKLNPSRAGKPDISTAVTCYFKAITIHPFEGKYYYLLSTCSKMKEDLFSAIYWGVRAYGCYHPYLMREKVQEFLEEARKSYNNMREKDFHDTKSSSLFKYFILSFLRYFNIVLTKIGFEELYTVSNFMYDCLQKYVNSLIQDKAKISAAKEGELLLQLVLLIIFAMHLAVEGYDENNLESLAKPRKKFNDIENNVLAKDCTKYTYGLIYHILELIVQIPEEGFINLLVPITYYLKEYKNITEYLISTYKPFKEKLVVVYKELSKTYRRLLEESKKEEADIENLTKSQFLNTDKQIIGFIPFKAYFDKNKKDVQSVISQDLQPLCKLYSILAILREIKCDTLEAASDGRMDKVQDLFNLDSMGIIPIDTEVISQIENFCGFGDKKETIEKTPIVLDGQNVAIRYGDDHFAAMGIKIVVDYWQQRGHTVQVMMPDFCFNREEVMLKKKLAESKGDSLKNIPDDVNLLLELKAKGIAFGIPNWNYDDSYIIEYAKNKNAYIVTNDRYNDHIQNYSKNDVNKKKKLKDWIRNNCISFTFIGKDFIPDPDFVNTHMK